MSNQKYLMEAANDDLINEEVKAVAQLQKNLSTAQLQSSFASLVKQAEYAEQRYLQNRDISGLNEAIHLWNQILQHSHFLETNKDFQLVVIHSSAGTYLRRYRATGQFNDLNIAISKYETAANVTLPNSPYLSSIFNNLGNGLIERYIKLGEIADLEKSVKNFQQAVNITPPNSPDLAGYFSNLGNGLHYCYTKLGKVANLEASIKNYRQAVNTTPPNSPNLAGYLNNLGNGLRARYSQLGDFADLEESIKKYQQAVNITSHNSPYLSIYLDSLGNGLLDCYARLGKVADLEESIKNYQQAVNITHSNSPQLPKRLNNLGNGLRNRYARLNEVADLEESIKKYQQAVNTTSPYSPDLAGYLNNLGSGLRDHYLQLSNTKDLEESIKCFQQAINTTSPNSPALASYINNLGVGLRDRYAHSGDVKDLEKSIKYFQQATNITSPNSPALLGYFNNSGNALIDRYTRSQCEEDLKQGQAIFKQALQLEKNAPIAVLLGTACNWLNWAFERESWEEMEESYPSMQNASRSLVGKQLSREHQEAFLEETQGIAAKVAYSHIQRNDLKQAVEALEQGAARLLSAALLARSKVDLQQLEQQYSDLYQDYQQQFKSLQNVQYVYQHAPLERQSEALQKFQSENERFNEILNRIRQQKGFEHFLSIATDSNVVFQAAQTHPLIYIFSTDKGGYALIVFRNDIKVISLPELKNDVLTKGLQAYFKVYNLHSKNFKAWQDKIEETTSWLWEIIWQPLIEFLPKEQKNITLIPNGLLNLLPLHLAWTQKGDKKHYILDDFVINYAPNALSLETAKKRPSLKPDKLLIIDDPFNKLKRLDYANIEATTIAKHFNQNKVFSQHEAVLENVKNELEKDYNVLHFSCHGLSNLRNPLETGLCMVDYSNDDKDCSHKLTVQDFLNAKLNARLVTLSACETGMIGTKLPEEVVNLPASLLQAGVAGVVASLWAVSDFSTALLMIKFYENFAQQSDNIALSLQQAQHWLRDSTNKDFLKYIEKHQLSLDATQKRPFRKNNPQDKPFQHCYYWGAFYVTGI